jgi:hypothetical protein
MEYYITKENLPNFMVLPKTFDWLLVDQERGFNKIFEIIPVEIFQTIIVSTDPAQIEISRLLNKAAVHYSFVLSIPKIKVHINNTGLNNFEQDKLKTAAWWDVRDLGLSLLKYADELFSKALTAISKVDALKSQIPFFTNVSDIVSSPEIFESVYSINNSPEVFKMLQAFIQQSYIAKICDKLTDDCLILIKADPTLQIYLRNANVFFALYYASLLPAFVFLQNAVAIQYDELPWQKSIVLDQNARSRAGQNFMSLAEENMSLILKYLKSHPTDFPCYVDDFVARKVISLDSGLYF